MTSPRANSTLISHVTNFPLAFCQKDNLPKPEFEGKKLENIQQKAHVQEAIFDYLTVFC